MMMSNDDDDDDEETHRSVSILSLTMTAVPWLWNGQLFIGFSNYPDDNWNNSDDDNHHYDFEDVQ